MPTAFYGYLLILFSLVGITPFLPVAIGTAYLSFAIFLCGMAAIVFQKKAHGERFVDMGFKLNRNALVGVGLAVVFTALVYAAHLGIPWLLGWVTIRAIPHSAGATNPPWVTSLLVLFVGGFIMFLNCLFGEELAFRGYVLPRLTDRLGSIRGIFWCAIIFAVWHLPSYFSIYRGSEALSGWDSLAGALLTHGISVLPVCILYLTTRELYGVSVYHALVDIIQYAILRNPMMGEASRDALFEFHVRNPVGMDFLGWFLQFLAIPVMWALCRLARRWLHPAGAEAQGGCIELPS